MTSGNKQKLNYGCINIFRFLMLLYEDKAYYNDVVKIYKNAIDEKTNNTVQVVINKAINALRVFGIKIVKNKNKYSLDSSLYSINYDLNDLKSISMLISAIDDYPDEKSKTNIMQFLKNLQIRMDNNSKNTLSSITINHDFSFFYKDLKDQIESCKKLCKDNMSFSIRYLQKGKEYSTRGIAKDIIFNTKNAYFRMFDINNNLQLEIPLPNILSIISDPTMGKSPESATTITMKISGRLAKIYKLKENESLLEYNDKGEMIVINKGESIDKLFSRIMRYTDCCQIIRPKSIQAKMQNLINETLAQYEENK